MLIVPVVSGPDERRDATVVANPFLDAEAVGEIEVALKALGAKGAAEQHHPLVSRHRCRWPACWRSGWARSRDEWPADVIRRAAGWPRGH